MQFIDHARGLLGDRSKTSDAFPLSLALQGGGSFGAFTWGALDRLLESRTSGSTRSAARAPARSTRCCWPRGCSRRSGGGARKTAAVLAAHERGGLVSADDGRPRGHGRIRPRHGAPQFNPFDLNPLRAALAEEVDFERLRAELADSGC